MLAFERYSALVKPKSHHRTRLKLGKQSLRVYFNFHYLRILKYIGPIVIISTVYSIPRWLELEVDSLKTCNETFNTQNNSNDSNNDSTALCDTTYEIIVTRLRSDNYYILWYLNVANLIITIAIPLVSLTYLNAKVYERYKDFIKRILSLLIKGFTVDKMIKQYLGMKFLQL